MSMDQVPKQQRLVALAIEDYALKQPERIFAYVQLGRTAAAKYKSISYSMLDRAINKLAWWLDTALTSRIENFGSFPTVLFIGANFDFRQIILTVALIKTKRKIMLPSALLPTKDIAKIIRSTETVGIILGGGVTDDRDGWSKAASAAELPQLALPEMDWLLEEDDTPSYPYARNLNDGWYDPVYVLQTSGSTGNPKTIVHRAGAMFRAGEAILRSYETAKDEKLAAAQLFHDSHFLCTLHLAWSAGVTFTLMYPIWTGCVPILPSETQRGPVTALDIFEALPYVPRGKRNGILLVPSLLRAIVQMEGHGEALKSFQWVAYTGAPLPRSTGDVASRYTQLQGLLGSTDVGLYPLLQNPPGIPWYYLRLHPDYLGFFLSSIESSGAVEVCIRRLERDTRHCFEQDTNLNVYHTQDMWTPVQGDDRAESQGFFVTSGRLDDFVKLSSLHKIRVSALETELREQPWIKECVVGGADRERLFLLIEPNETTATISMQALDYVLELCNSKIPSAFHLTRDLVLTADPARPLLLTGKSTLDRHSTLQLYKDDIEQMYVRYQRSPPPE